MKQQMLALCVVMGVVLAAWRRRDPGDFVRAALVSRDGLVVAIVRWIAAPWPRTHHWRRESGRHQTVTTHLADVGDRERMRELAREVAGAHGAVHLLINNAGIGCDAVWLNRKLSPVRVSSSCVW